MILLMLILISTRVHTASLRTTISPHQIYSLLLIGETPGIRIPPLDLCIILLPTLPRTLGRCPSIPHSFKSDGRV